MVLLLCLSYGTLYSQQPALDSCDIEYKKALRAFASYENLWRRDSFGSNGVRFILTEEFFGRPECFKGKNGAQLKLYLGPPLYTYKATDGSLNGNKEKATYRYPIMTPQGFYEFHSSGNRYVDFYVIDGVIMKLSFLVAEG